ncbi:MAG TPA: Ser-Thr-rich GPI-anchored membrane family protein [Candidatus Paceibacterota bacterium]|nr:Ser-Thr-rich GPI-anchored membrane family protein [Candidatus Paceibacterota bacterium]
MKTRNTVLIIIVVLLIGGFILFKKKAVAPVETNTSSQNMPDDNQTPAGSTTAGTPTSNTTNGRPNCLPNDPASIKVTSPTAGQSYSLGEEVTIKWTSCNVNSVHISLGNGGKDMGMLTQSLIPARQGYYIWKVNSSWAAQENIHTGYFFSIYSANGAAEVMGKSATFTIN